MCSIWNRMIQTPITLLYILEFIFAPAAELPYGSDACDLPLAPWRPLLGPLSDITAHFRKNETKRKKKEHALNKHIGTSVFWRFWIIPCDFAKPHFETFETLCLILIMIRSSSCSCISCSTCGRQRRAVHTTTVWMRYIYTACRFLLLAGNGVTLHSWSETLFSFMFRCISLLYLWSSARNDHAWGPSHWIISPFDSIKRRVSHYGVAMISKQILQADHFNN